MTNLQFNMCRFHSALLSSVKDSHNLERSDGFLVGVIAVYGDVDFCCLCFQCALEWVSRSRKASRKAHEHATPITPLTVCKEKKKEEEDGHDIHFSESRGNMETNQPSTVCKGMEKNEHENDIHSIN